MANLSKGSSGSSVKELQRLLNNAGYNLAEDGIFGNKTLAAVKDYQSKNGLAVDGIAGPKTMAALQGTGSSSTTTTTAPKTFEQMSTSEKVSYLESNKPTVSDPLKDIAKPETPQELTNLLANKPGEYQTPQEVKDALAKLTELEGKKPGPYESRYDSQIQGLLDQINNREPFSYDFTKDPMYQQYKDEYTNNAKMAMMDTMGEAAALTGGYGSSYASTAGQQAYQNQMRSLSTDIIPELWNMSYQVYKDNEQSLYNQLSAFQSQDAAEYQRYADQLDAYYNDLNYFFNKYQYLDESAYQRYVNDLEQWNKDRAYYYQLMRDQMGDYYNDVNLAMQQNDTIMDDYWQTLGYWNDKAMQEAALAAASSGGSGSGSGGSGRRSSSGGNDDKGSTPTVTLDPQNVSAQSPSFYEEVASRLNRMAKNGKSRADMLKELANNRKNLTTAEYNKLYNSIGR